MRATLLVLLALACGAQANEDAPPATDSAAPEAGAACEEAPAEEEIAPADEDDSGFDELACGQFATLDEVRARQADVAALPAPDWAQAPQRAVHSVYAGGLFGRTLQEPGLRWEWRFDWPDEEEQAGKPPAFLKALLEWLSGLSAGLGVLMHLLLWSLLLLLVIGLWRLWRRYAARNPRIAGDIARADHWLASPLRLAEALPEDVIAAARALWQAQRGRDALSLLYRAALVRLGERHGFRAADSATEGECLRLVRRHVPVVAAPFGALVQAWTQAAWNHRLPDSLDAAIAAYRATLAADMPAATLPAAGVRP